MSTPLQRAEELKSLISQYQAELSDIYSKIHVSKTTNQIIRSIDKIIIKNTKKYNKYITNKLYNGISSVLQENQKNYILIMLFSQEEIGYKYGWHAGSGWNSLKNNISDPIGHSPVYGFYPVMFV